MRWAMMICALALVTACGDSKVKEAVEMCQREVSGRLNDKMAEFDSSAMAAGASTAEDGTITMHSEIKYRAGTSDEGTQPFTCVVATKNDAGEYAPRVIQVTIDPLGYKKTG